MYVAAHLCVYVYTVCCTYVHTYIHARLLPPADNQTNNTFTLSLSLCLPYFPQPVVRITHEHATCIYLFVCYYSIGTCIIYIYMHTYVRAPVSMWTRERCVYNIDGWVGVCVLFVPGTGVGGEGVQGGRIVDDENGYRAS